MRKQEAKLIVSECQGCIRVLNDNTCLGWTEREYKWRNGQCTEYSTCEEERNIIRRLHIEE